MFYHIIASGSKGNATIIGNETTTLLVDLGISKTRFIQGLAEIHKHIEDIDGCLLTHDHSDHIRGIKFISPKKVYGLNGVIPSLGHLIELYKSFNIGSFKITPIEISHDASAGAGYIIEDDREKLVYITDTGIVLDEVYEYAYNPDYLIIESNHDIKMLLKTHRPQIAKQRILSEVGHLCNEDSAFASIKMIGPRTKEIVLAHISEEANSNEVALSSYQRIYAYSNININNFKLVCAPQWHSYTGGKYEY